VIALEDVKDDTVVTVSFKATQAAEGKAVSVDSGTGNGTVNGIVFVNTKPGTDINKIPAGTKVYLVAAAKDGYETEKVEVFKKTGGDNAEALTLDDDMAFIMPDADVIVKASFKEILLHDHTLVIDKKVAPTCTETGLTVGSHCSECGEVIVPREEIPALGHIEITEPGKEENCEENGLTEKIYCSVCGEVIKEHTVIPAKGHDDVIIRGGKVATFTSDGNTEEKKCNTCGRIEGGDIIYRIDKVELEKDSYTYEGTAITPAVIAKDSAGQTIGKEFYTVIYSGNNGTGTGKAVVIFKDDYSGIKELTFTIMAGHSGQTTPAPTKTPEPTSNPTATPEVTPNPTATPEIIQEPTATADNTPAPTASAQTTPAPTTAPQATPAPTATTQASPAPTEAALTKVEFTSVKNKKTRSITVSIKSVTGAKGYQVQYTRDKKFKKGVVILKSAKTSVKTKKLKLGKIYYVRVRAWKKDLSGKKVYGAWSKTVKVKIKK